MDVPLSSMVGGLCDVAVRVYHGPDSDGIVPEQLRDDKRVSTVLIEASEPESLAGGVSRAGTTAGEKGRVISMATISKAKLRKRDLKRWESTFLRHKTAPPDGWKRYLRDGWSQGLDGWRARYKLYLLSHAWRQRRDGALRRANGCCAMCEQPTDRPQVHHVNYMRVGAEQVEDLRVLCKPCHGVVHTMKRTPNIPMDDQTRAMMMAREYREQGRALRQKAAALAAGELTPEMPERPRIRRRPKPETPPEAV